MAASRVHYGYRRLHVLLLREGWKVNAKRVYRLYKLEGLSLRLKKSKKRVSRLRVMPPAAQQPNERWSMDFMSDRLANGRRFRVFTLVDNFSRVSPASEVDFSLTRKRVVEVLERLKSTSGLPQILHCDNGSDATTAQMRQRLRCDNGSEFISRAVDDWANRNGVKLDFSRPGKPTDNPFIESFNGKLRIECLNQHWFENIQEAQSIIEKWRKEYNQERPHRSLQGQTPLEFEERWRGKMNLKKAA